MDRKVLYETATEYRKAKLWEILHDDDLFAIRFEDGEVGYACVMGAAQQVYALALYMGEEGLSTYYELYTRDENTSAAQQEMIFYGQDCLMCSFEKRNEMTEEDMEEIHALGLRFRGDYTYPVFRRYQPYRVPWRFQEDSQDRRMLVALRAALALRAKFPRTGEVGEDDFSAIGFSRTTMPLLIAQEESFIFDRMDIPDEMAIPIPSPRLTGAFLIARLKKQKIRHGKPMICSLMMLPMPVDGTPPCFPVMLLLLEQEGLAGTPMVQEYPEEAGELLEGLLAFIEEQGKPEKILVADTRTYVLLQNITSQLGIPLVEMEQIPPLEDFQQDFREFMLMQHELPSDEE